MRKAIRGLVAPISRCMDRFKIFIQHGHPYSKVLSVVFIAIPAVFSLGLFFALPHADSASVRDGFTIIAEILGVLLGAILVIVGLLVEQEQKSRDHLRRIYYKIYVLIQSNQEKVYEALQELVERYKNENLLPSKVAHKGYKWFDPELQIGSLVGLSVALGLVDLGTARKTLLDLGLTLTKTTDFNARGTLAASDPFHFFSLADKALDPWVMQAFCKPLYDLAHRVYLRFHREGVNEALEYINRSRTILRSNRLAITLPLLTFTTMSAILAIFGTADQIVPNFGLVIAIAMGFLLSMLSTLWLIEKILT